ncbi:MAG: hypothetical protein IJ599_02855, partial [Alphaproteobacteria bacterium]|nr:hypothetical protein [Alphaproteobacteria bacterium]
IQMATVTNTSLPEGQNRANWSITGLVSSGKFWGYALPNAYTPPTPDNTKFAGYALLDRDMQFSPYKEVKDYDNRESFLKNCCLSGDKVHGLSNPRGFCLVNTCFQMLHNSAQVRRIVAAFKNGDLKGRSRVVNKIAEGFALIENGNGLNVEVFKKYLEEFASEADKAKGSEIYECLTKGEKITPYFLDCFVALLINECTKCGNDVLRGNFLSQNMEVVKCVECGAVAQSLDEDNVFSFTDGCPDGLLNYLGKACIPDGCERGNVCSKCKQSNTEFCWQKYFYFPNILILLNMPADEENPRFFSSYPETLELTDIEGAKKYELVAQGIGNEGHSFSRIKLNNGKWITVDDAQVLTEYQVQQNGDRISVNDGRFAQDERCWGLVYEQR